MPFSLLSTKSRVLDFVLMEGRKKLKFYFGWRKAHSFASFGLCVGLCGLQMCVLLCVENKLLQMIKVVFKFKV